MEQIKLIIFDLDRTIFDWDAAQKIAFQEVNQLLPSIAVDQFWTIYQFQQEKLFKQYLEKEISIEQYRLLRYAKTLEKFDIEDLNLAREMNDCFIKTVSTCTIYCYGAEQLLNYVKKLGIPQALLTNGPADGQRIKIMNLNLDKYFQKIYISGETGIAKPNIQAFLQILEYFQLEAKHCLMVGDDFDIDLFQAQKLGMQTFG